MAHANARTNVFARRLIVERVAAGWPAARVAEQLGVTRATVHKLLRRCAEGGDAALADRSSRPHRIPNRTAPQVEKKVLAARRRRKRGAVVLTADLGMSPSTVGRILARHDVPHLAAIDPITGETHPLLAAQPEPLRAPHAGGDDPHGRQETRPYPGRRGLAVARPREDPGPQAQEDRDRLRLRPQRHRRPHPPGLRRDPLRRERPDLRRAQRDANRRGMRHPPRRARLIRSGPYAAPCDNPAL
ncbi:helix-turn-helix domain-containing protein [Sciscionella sediminilitoris]|uniref:helix-turn-helix domain-containing protein n=1 Tax=Sciscionella sediminilitoris TaxID=1445613 RepID=UPI0012E10E99